MTDPKIAKAQRALEVERCRRDPHYFIFEAGVLRTKDEHDTGNPIKAVPDELALRALLDLYLVSGRLMQPEDARWALEAEFEIPFLAHIHQTGVLFLEKSRDVFATNLTCCYLLWRARAYAYQKIMVQSLKEDWAANLVYNKEPFVARISFMEDQLPRHLRQCVWPRSGAFGRLYYPNGSQIWGIAEGGNVIRSEHPTVIFSDEAGFQPEFGESYTAALPAVQGGGQYLAISSANPGEFCNIVSMAAA